MRAGALLKVLPQHLAGSACYIPPCIKADCPCGGEGEWRRENEAEGWKELEVTVLTGCGFADRFSERSTPKPPLPPLKVMLHVLALPGAT